MSVTPYLVCRNAAEAVDFYQRAFDAKVVDKYVMEDGRLGHATLTVAGESLYLSDEYPELGVTSPQLLGGTAVAVHLTVPDVDAWWERAVLAGASEDRQPQDAGDKDGRRSAVVKDPYGHRWMLSQFKKVESFDFDHTYLHLDGSKARKIEVTEDFWANIDQRYDLHVGRLMLLFSNTEDWKTWEIHPAGDEVVYLLSGSIDVILDGPAGQQVVELRGRSACIVPQNTWHRAIVHQPGDALFVTPGAGTQTRPVEA
jgi:PhnB protein